MILLWSSRGDPDKIIKAVEEDFDGINWEEKRISRRKRMPGELSNDEPASSAEEKWKRDIFYIAVDAVNTGITERFSESRHILKAFSIFSPKSFSTFSDTYPTVRDVEINVRQFCETYNIDSHRRAKKLVSFAAAFKHFNLDLVEGNADRNHDNEHYDYTQDEFNDDSYDDDNDDDELFQTDIQEETQTFIDCLSLLTDKKYSLIDAYPTLVRVYAIAMAIPITSCSAERSFSTLKRVKTRLRSSMLQERLEGLMLMSIERKILLKLNRQKLIDLLGKSSKELAKALL